MRRAGASDRHEAPWHVVSLTPTLQSKALNIGPNQRRLRDGLLLCLEGVAAAERTGHSAVVRIKADRASLGYDDVKVALELSVALRQRPQCRKARRRRRCFSSLHVWVMPRPVHHAGARATTSWVSPGVDIAESASIGLSYGNRTTGQGAGGPSDVTD